jgi:hypothetical protein
MGTMQRSFLACGALVAMLIALAPAVASAQSIELGATSTRLVAPTCPRGVSPAHCTIILTRTTALETLRDRVAYPTTVKTAGRIVAFTVGLSRLSSDVRTARSDIHFLDSTYGGTTRLAIAVLKPIGAKSHRRWQVVAQSPVIHVQPWLGQVVRFPLATSLPVAPGETVALTTPTWAPVLSIDLSTKSFAYRQSRTSACTSPPATSAAQSVGQSAQYLCDYTGTRVEYSATEITSKAPPTSVSSSVCPAGTAATACPAILARTTALETLSEGVAYPTTVKAAGSLVSFSVALSRLAAGSAARLSDERALDRAFGSPPEVAVTVLKPVGPARQRRWTVTAVSPAFAVSSYLGGAVEFALPSSLQVSRGDTIALTTPTWAPVLSSGPPKRVAYRQSRAGACSRPPSTNAAQLTMGASTRYLCNYAGTAVAYTVNVLPAPVVPKNYVRSAG